MTIERQYQEAKERHPGMLLLLRVGDTYRLFFEDARVASAACDLTISLCDGIPMVGFHWRALAVNLRKLLNVGHRVAVCDYDPEKPQ